MSGRSETPFSPESTTLESCQASASGEKQPEIRHGELGGQRGVARLTGNIHPQPTGEGDHVEDHFTTTINRSELEKTLRARARRLTSLAREEEVEEFFQRHHPIRGDRGRGARQTRGCGR